MLVWTPLLTKIRLLNKSENKGRIEDTLGMMDFQGEAVFFLKINIFGGAQYNF